MLLKCVHSDSLKCVCMCGTFTYMYVTECVWVPVEAGG